MRGTILNIILRWIVGATFLFSGFAKSVDPVGTAIYVDKYLATYSLEAMMPLSEGMAILLSTLEMLLGVLLITGVLRRWVSLVSLVLISIFSVVTFLSATVLPIGDCGCFGDILKLTPWQTFLKNIYLLLLCIVLWRNSREQQNFTMRGLVVIILGVAIPLAINLYALRHLPIVDSMPYKVGTALRDEVSKEREVEEQSVQNILIFKNLTTGENVEFDAADTACWSDVNLEYVDVVTRTTAVDATYSEFRLYDADGQDRCLDVVWRNGRVALLCINEIPEAPEAHMWGISSLLSQYPSQGVVVLSAVDKSLVDKIIEGVEILTIDAMTLRSVIRSDIGVVILRDGVIEFKSDIRDI